MNQHLSLFKLNSFVSLLLSALVPATANAISLPQRLARPTVKTPTPPQLFQLPFLSARDISSDSNLSPLERQVLEEINRVRANPSAYADWLEEMKSYYYGNLLQLPEQPTIRTQEGVNAVEEAIRYLRNQQPLPPLRLSPGMSLAAKDHVRDIGERGIIGHYGSDGSQFSDRLGRYGTSGGAIGENISYGVTTARAIVMQLVVDDGVLGRFHRENMFYDRFQATGVACGVHRRYEQSCAILFSAEYQDNLASIPAPPAVNPTRLDSPSSTASIIATQDGAALATPPVVLPPMGIQAPSPDNLPRAIVTVPPPPASRAVTSSVNVVETPAVPTPSAVISETPTPAPAGFILRPITPSVPTPAAVAPNTVAVEPTPTAPAVAIPTPVPTPPAVAPNNTNTVAVEPTPTAPAVAIPTPVPTPPAVAPNTVAVEPTPTAPAVAIPTPVPTPAAVAPNNTNPVAAEPNPIAPNNANPVAAEPTPTPAATPSNANVANVSLSAAPNNSQPAALKTLLQEQGSLANGDLVYSDGSLYDFYTLQGRAGQTIAISVTSSNFDTFLAVFDEANKVVGQNDDIDAKNTNSYLKITFERDGAYRIFINGYDARDRGNYTLTVVE